MKDDQWRQRWAARYFEWVRENIVELKKYQDKEDGPVAAEVIEEYRSTYQRITNIAKRRWNVEMPTLDV